MANILDYIQWRGNIDMQNAKFNEIDNLILSRVAYFPFDGIIEYNEEIPLKYVYERFKQKNINSAQVLQKEDLLLFPALAKSKRFADLVLTKYVNKIDMEEEKQFSAITILLPDKTMYVAFRGTDNTFIGWKEDFKLCFQGTIYSQIDAVKYLQSVADNYTTKLIRVGGHSKGGNLAVYASAFCKSDYQERIIEIYNNDGPGFELEITQKEGYTKVLDKMHTFIPQSSVVGRLLNNSSKYMVVKSTQVGIMQHDLYTWQLMGPQFIYADELTDESTIINKTLKKWLVEVDAEQRKTFVDSVFNAIYSTKAKTLPDFSAKWFDNMKTVLKSYQSIDKKSKEIIGKSLGKLFNIVKDNIIKKI